MTRNVTILFPRGKCYKACPISALLLVASLALPSFADGDDSYVCDQVSSMAAAETGVPVSVLKAISLTETGRQKNDKVRPWPWTVNMEGKGVYFPNQDEAQAFVFKHFKRGARSFDVGCFQINYKWHHQNFDSLEEMFDPLLNGLYAARFLRDLYDEKGNWRDAAGAYHSRTPKYAEKYKQRFSAYRAQLPDQDMQPVQVANVLVNAQGRSSQEFQEETPRVNHFPLLQMGQGQTGMGSLVPIGSQPATPFFTNGNG